MNAKQLLVVAAKIPSEKDREVFIQRMQKADALHHEATALRRLAWESYRGLVPPTPKKGGA